MPTVSDSSLSQYRHLTSNPEIAGVIAPALFTTIIVSPSQSPFLVSLQAGFIARWYEHVPIDPATCNRCARGILREVLDELPIVALRIVEIPALAVGMRVRWRGVLVSG